MFSYIVKERKQTLLNDDNSTAHKITVKKKKSTDRQYLLVLGKKIFVRNFKWQLNVTKYENHFPILTGGTLQPLPLLY